MNQKDQGHAGDQSASLKPKQESIPGGLSDPSKRKDNPEPQSIRGSSSSKNKIFQQFIAGGNQYPNQVNNLDQQQKTAKAQNIINESDAAQQTTQHQQIKHAMPPKPLKASPSNKMITQFQAYPGPTYLNQHISNSKKTFNDIMHTHLSNFGKQAIGGSSISKVLQIKNQTLSSQKNDSHKDQRDLILSQQHSGSKEKHNISSGDLLIQQQNYNKQSNTIEDATRYSKPKLHADNSASGLNNTGDKSVPLQPVSIENSFGHVNNLNQGLMQIQPQKTQRGQRRHFPQHEPNEFELLMKSSQQKEQVSVAPTPQTNKQDQLHKGNIQQTAGNMVIRRGPFPAQIIFDLEPTSAAAASESNNRMTSNPRQNYQQSIFQKRNKLQLVNQTQSSEGPQHQQADQPSANQGTPNYQFKGLFVGQPSGKLQHVGQNLIGRSSPKSNIREVSREKLQQVSNQPQFHHFRMYQENGSQSLYLKDESHLHRLQNQFPESHPQIGGRNFQLQLQIPQKNFMTENPNNTSTGSNEINNKISKENLFSPQPKTSSGMSQYENSKIVGSNTAQLIIRKTNPQNLDDKLLKTPLLIKTDEKQKSASKSNEQQIHNFRKYKKKARDPTIENQEMNVLGQPKTIYGEEAKRTKQQDVSLTQIGTGLYQNKRRSFFSKNTEQNQVMQTSLNLPSMINNSDKNTISTTQHAGATHQQQSTTYKPETMVAPNSIRRKIEKSIFGVSSNITENVIQDVNYNVKGTNDNKRIAWEIKFHDSMNDENMINMSQDFIATELKKHRNSKHKSPLIKQLRHNNITKGSFQKNEAKSNPTTDKRKIFTKINLTNSSFNDQPSPGKINTQKIKFGGLQHSGENMLIENSNVFRRQAGAIKLKELREAGEQKAMKVNHEPVNTKQKIKIDESLSAKQHHKIKSCKIKQQIKQYDGELPAELIVTGYLKHATINSEQANSFKLKKPSPKFMNYVGKTPKKDGLFEQSDHQINDDKFEYQVVESINDNEFFKTTSEREFDQYMQQHEDASMSFLILERSDVNPSGNPASEIVQNSDSSFERHEAENDDVSISVENMVPEIENEIVKGTAQKCIVRKSKEVSGQKSFYHLTPPQLFISHQHHKMESMKQKEWSGGVSAQTQILFTKVISQNSKIHEKLLLLQDIGISNESNSLFKQIIEEIQALEKNLSKNEIINCIKASSFGKPSAIEPIKSDPSSKKIWLGVKRDQLVAYQKKVTYSGEQSHGYSQYQKDFLLESNMLPEHLKQPMSRSVKSIFWRNTHEGKTSQPKQKISKSIQLFQSRGKENEINLLQHSINFPVIRSLNLNSSGARRGIVNPQQQKFDLERANTDRLVNINLKKSVLSLNLNQINMNQVRNQARQSLVQNFQGPTELRKIQTERKLEDRYVVEESEQHNIPSNNEVLFKQFKVLDQLPIMYQTEQFQIIQQAYTHLKQTKLYAQTHRYSNIKKSDSLSNEDLNQQKSSNNSKNIVLMTLKQNQLNEQTQNSGSSGSCIQGHVNIKKAEHNKVAKFTSYNHNNIIKEPVSSSSIPSQSQRSLPTLQDCHSSNVRFKNDKQSSSSGIKGSCSGSNEKYGKKYGKKPLGVDIQKSQVLEAPPVILGNIFKWRQEEIIGLGSSSVVYRAIKLDSNEVIAVKKFKVVNDVTGVDQVKLKTIKNEIQKYKLLTHQNVVKFYGCELLDQFFCMYLEKLDTSLANVLSEQGQFTESQIKKYTLQILQGLQFLHQQKIKHLDLKCSNILTNQGCEQIKLCDFGSAREFKKNNNQSQIIGSVQWMAPEVIAEKGSGSKSDVWSLGCTIIEMFVGGNPWGDRLDDQNIYMAQQILLNSEELPSIPEDVQISASCMDFIGQCLIRDYNNRPSAAELLQHQWITSD